MYPSQVLIGLVWFMVLNATLNYVASLLSIEGCLISEVKLKTVKLLFADGFLW
jgi:hypothetical protein